MNVRNKYGSSSASTIAVLLLSRIVRGVGLDALSNLLTDSATSLSIKTDAFALRLRCLLNMHQCCKVSFVELRRRKAVVYVGIESLGYGW